jgi:hypothetical protein
MDVGEVYVPGEEPMIVELLLEAVAHEILARPAWSLRMETPRHHAAAAGYLAFAKSRKTQGVMLATGLAVSAGVVHAFRAFTVLP